MCIDMKRENVIRKYSCIEINFRYYCVHSKRGNHHFSINEIGKDYATVTHHWNIREITTSLKRN